MQSDLSPHCAIEENLEPWLSNLGSQRTLLSILRMRRHQCLLSVHVIKYISHVTAHLNPFMSSRCSYFSSLDKFISYIIGVWLVFIIVMFYRNNNANNVDPDQTPRSAASDLGLHCLLMPLLWDARLIWVNTTRNMFIEIIM